MSVPVFSIGQVAWCYPLTQKLNRTGPIGTCCQSSTEHRITASVSLKNSWTASPVAFSCKAGSLEACAYSYSPARDWSLGHLSDAFSFLFSIFAILEPNCIALFGRTEEAVKPSSAAARRNSSFSPTPRGRAKFAFSQTGRELRKETTSSSRKGNLKWREMLRKKRNVTFWRQTIANCF